MKDEDSFGDESRTGGGYRGWGAAAPVAVGRKTSTNASGSAQQGFSDSSTLQPGSPLYPVEAPATHVRNGTLDSETMGPYAPAGAAGGAALARGASNASSTYSNNQAGRNSDQDYPIPYLPGQAEYYDNNGNSNAYYQANGPYEAYTPQGGQPVMREGPGRRLTHVQEGGNAGGGYPQQSGISRNF
jgi:hypothetical protein